VQRPLGKVDVEVHAEIGQRGLDLGEHQPDAFPAEHVQIAGRGGVRVAPGHLGRHLGHVAAVVAVSRHWLTPGRGEQRRGELIDLRACVVEVVLGDHARALGPQQPGQRVADRRPADTGERHRPGRVRGHELQVDPGAGQRVARPVAAALVGDQAREAAQRGRGQPDIQEPGAGDLDLADRRVGAEPGGQRDGELARARPDRGRQLQGSVGRVVAVLGTARPFQRQRGHRRGRRQAAA
jgi:hypothetical protein